MDFESNLVGTSVSGSKNFNTFDGMRSVWGACFFVHFISVQKKWLAREHLVKTPTR